MLRFPFLLCTTEPLRENSVRIGPCRVRAPPTWARKRKKILLLILHFKKKLCAVYFIDGKAKYENAPKN